MDESVKIEVTGRIDGKIATSIRDIARAAIEADTNLDLLRQALRDVSSVSAFKTTSSDVRTLRNEVKQTQASVNALGGAVNGTASDFTRMASSVSKANAELRKTQSGIAGVKSAAGGLRSAIGPLAGAFSAVFAVRAYAQAQDSLTSIQNKIRSITDDLERQTAVQGQLFDIANRTRSGIEATTDGFVRFSKAMDDAADSEVLRFVETLNKSLISAGRSTAEVNSIVIQLGQALTSGRLMGDEFRSLSENLPRDALQAIADTLGATVEELKGLSTQGVITTDVLRQAFANFADEADAAFARTVPTIGQALTVLENQFIAFTESTTSGASLISSAILFIGDNLNVIIPLVGLFAAAWVAVQIVTIVSNLLTMASSLIRVGAAFAVANAPILLITAALLTLGAVLLIATGNMDKFLEFVGTLPEMLGNVVGTMANAASGTMALGDSTKGVGESYADMATQANTAGTSINGAMTGLTGSTNTALQANQQYAGSFNQLQSSSSSAFTNATTGANGAAAAVNTATTATNSFKSSLDTTSTAATGLNSTVTHLGGTSSIAFAKGVEGANSLTDALVETEAQSNAVISTLQGIVDWVGQALAAIGNMVAAAARAVERALGTDDDPLSVTSMTGSDAEKASVSELPKFKEGGSFKVGGTGRGVDRNLVQFRANRGEQVDVSTKSQQRAAQRGNGGGNGSAPVMVFNITTKDADSFRRSRGQIATDMMASFT